MRESMQDSRDLMPSQGVGPDSEAAPLPAHESLREITRNSLILQDSWR